MVKSIVLRFVNIIGETGLYRILRPNRIPVFMLHRVTDGTMDLPGSLSAKTLRSYLSYLASNHYQVLSMEELWSFLYQENRVPNNSVMFTIDDGFSDHHDVAARIFDEFGFKLNFFVITGLLDEQLWPWDSQVNYALKNTCVALAGIELPSGKVYPIDLNKRSVIKETRNIRNALKTEKQEKIYDWIKFELYRKLEVDYPRSIPEEFRPMSWEDARSLRARGHGVYPHTHSHRILSTLSLDEKRLEIAHSTERIKQELNFFPEVFAYPTGRQSDYDWLDVREVQKAGFKMVFNSVSDYIRPGGSMYELPRFSLPDNQEHFFQIVNRFEALKSTFREVMTGAQRIWSKQRTDILRSTGKSN